MQTRKHDAAMPYNHEQDDGSFISDPGLTKREFFAAAALQGLLANRSITDCEMYPPINIPERAVVLADALIFELNNQDEKQP